MNEIKFNVAVIGGGPAGMIAAGTAAKKGAKVIIIEKNKSLGRKLLITGKGRCNITNATYDLREFIKNFGKNGKFLYSALQAFGIEETIRFFNNNGLKTKTERGNRVFPESDKSADVLNVLTKYLEDNSVTVKTNTEIKRIKFIDDKIESIENSHNRITADNFILCTGGLAFPGTGSTGDGFKWLKTLGHTVTKPEPALMPIIVEEDFVESLKGLTLKNVVVSVYQDNKKKDERFGEASFTNDGMDGPIILDMSKTIHELLHKEKPLQLKIDLKSALDYNELDKRIQRDLNEANNKSFKNSLDKLLPKQMIPTLIKVSKIDPEKKANSITKEERKKLIHLFKDFTLNIKETEGFDKSIITSGGLKLSEVDPKTMCSKIIKNLYIAGEILDLDGPTGGYNLQICWSTGYLAGSSIL